MLWRYLRDNRHWRGRSLLLFQDYWKIHRGLLGTISTVLFSRAEFGALIFDLLMSGVNEKRQGYE